MNYRALAAFGISMVFVTAHARAQNEDEDESAEDAKTESKGDSANAAKASGGVQVGASADPKGRAPRPGRSQSEAAPPAAAVPEAAPPARRSTANETSGRFSPMATPASTRSKIRRSPSKTASSRT